MFKLLKNTQPIHYLLGAFVVFIICIIFFGTCNLAKGQQSPKPQPPTIYSIQGDANYMNTLIRLINKAQQATYNSKLPSYEANPIIDSLTLFTQNFIQQFNYQDSLRLAVAKPKPDTTKHK